MYIIQNSRLKVLELYINPLPPYAGYPFNDYPVNDYSDLEEVAKAANVELRGIPNSIGYQSFNDTFSGQLNGRVIIDVFSQVDEQSIILPGSRVSRCISTATLANSL